MADAVPGALVLGADYRALGVVRSLGRHGIPVWVVRTPEDHRLAGLSRYCDRRLTFPQEDDAARRDRLLALAHARGLRGWVLFPTADATAAFVAREHAPLGSCFRLSTPPWDIFRRAYDKRCTAGLATALGIPHPRTVPVPTRPDAERYAGPFPAVLKPATKPWLDRPAAKAWPAADPAELLRGYDDAAPQTEPGTLLVQELVPGRRRAQYSFAALCDGGRVLAWVTAERVRQHPPDFGKASTFVVSVRDPEVEETGRRVLAELGLTGLAEVEFKRDARTGRCVLLDVNVRVWGWHTIARRAGLDFPYLAWQLATGRPVREVCAPPGLRWLRLTTDAAAGVAELRDGRSALGYARSLVGRHEAAVAALDDPLPGLLEVPLYVLAVAARRRAAVSRRTGTARPLPGLRSHRVPTDR